MFIGGILVACTLLNLGWGTGYSSSDDEVVDGLVDNFARGVTCQQFEHWCEVNTCIYDVRWKVCHMILWRSRGFSSYPPHFFSNNTTHNSGLSQRGVLASWENRTTSEKTWTLEWSISMSSILFFFGGYLFKSNHSWDPHRHTKT